MAKAVTIGSRTFKTQTSALAHYKSLLGRYANGDRISNNDDHDDLVALIERYDAVLEEVGEPIKGDNQISHFERRLNTGTGWSTPGFWVVRQDNTATDFSYIDAVKGMPKGRSQDFYNACRDAVALDLITAKKRAFSEHGDDQGKVACEITGVKVSFEDAHLDHAWPYFSHIVSGFRAARGWSTNIPDGVVSEPADGQTQSKFLGKETVDAFRAFHNSQAILRILSKGANLQSASKARKPTVKRPVQII